MGRPNSGVLVLVEVVIGTQPGKGGYWGPYWRVELMTVGLGTET